MRQQPNIISIVELKQLTAAIDHLGADHNMRPVRPYDGQPWTVKGIRGSTQVVGLTMRDISDCYLRAFILSHPYFKDGTMEKLQPNATLIDEANKGENAVLCSNDLYSLVGNTDPIAISQNLGCEIEKMMGIFPNIKHSDSKDIFKSLFGKEPDDDKPS